MRKRKRKVIIAPKCNYCGQNSETFVVTAEGKTFCMVYRFVGMPPPIKTVWTIITEVKNMYGKKKSKNKKKKRVKAKSLIEEEILMKLSSRQKKIVRVLQLSGRITGADFRTLKRRKNAKKKKKKYSK